MKTHNRFPLIGMLLAGFLLSSAASGAPHYLINLSWAGGVDPLIFSVGGFFPEEQDLSDIENLNFADIEPFFRVITTPLPAALPNEMGYMWARMESGGGDEIFTVASSQFDLRAELVLPGALNNHDLANNSIIGLGSGDSNIESDLILPFLDGNSIREGFYHLTVLVSRHGNEWQAALSDNWGIATLALMVRNPSQVRLELPQDGEILTSNPIFMWAFPRQSGVSFLLEVVRGDPNRDPFEIMESPSPSDIYAQVMIEVPAWMTGGELTTHIYTGTGGEDPLIPNQTYYWRVTATAPGMMPGELHTIESPIYNFAYNLPGGGGGAGGGGGENPPPQQEPAIFTMLRYLLPADQFEAIISQFPNPYEWNLVDITLEDHGASLQELVNFLLTGNRTIVLTAVSE